MTVIAVRKYDNEIVLASDSQTTWGDSKLNDSKQDILTKPSKLFQENGLTVGIAGHVEEASLFKIYVKTHKPKQADEDSMLDFLVEFLDWAKKKDSTFTLKNHYIIIIENKIFMAIGLDIQEIKEYGSVGSGMFLALGAMFKGSKPEEAVEVAKEFDLYCNGKVSVFRVPIKKEK